MHIISLGLLIHTKHARPLIVLLAITSQYSLKTTPLSLFLGTWLFNAYANESKTYRYRSMSTKFGHCSACASVEDEVRAGG